MSAHFSWSPIMAASRTAELMALFRALETLQPPAERLFEDRLAARCLRPPLRAVLAAARIPALRRRIVRYIDSGWPGARSSGIARTRWIDDALRGALAAGCRQVVILGAGFDARAWRLPELAGVPFFELDRAPTQERKRRRLGAAPASVRFVGADLCAPDAGTRLREAGFDPALPTFFLLEGVSNYLDAASVDATVRFVAATAAPGSLFVFTYVHRGLLDGSVPFPDTGRLRRTLVNAGELWSFGLDPGELPAYLAERGLALVSDQGAREVRERVLGEPGSGYEFYRTAVACPRAGGPACRR
jgi:methyltransferase (TIGR00027 family)